jgi:hypothetical protein
MALLVAGAGAERNERVIGIALSAAFYVLAFGTSME